MQKIYEQNMKFKLGLDYDYFKAPHNKYQQTAKSTNKSKPINSRFANSEPSQKQKTCSPTALPLETV